MNAHHEELACLYVLDRLDARERADFEARLPRDSRLVAFVRELESTFARRIRALPQFDPPTDLLTRIEDRIDQILTIESAVSPPPRVVTPLWTSIARWGIAAVIAISLGTIAIQQLRHGPVAAERPSVIVVGLDSHQSIFTELPLQNPQDADASFIQLASLAEKYWEKPESLPVKSSRASQSGRGYALFDPHSNQGFIAIQQLPAIAHGQRYHLWLLDTASGATREAGVLPLTETNSGLYFFSVAPNAGVKPDRMDFFITAEDPTAPKSAEPRGKVVLGDKGF